MAEKQKNAGLMKIKRMFSVLFLTALSAGCAPSGNSSAPEYSPPAVPPSQTVETGEPAGVVPFVWLNEREITPSADGDVDFKDLTEAFFDMTAPGGGKTVYAYNRIGFMRYYFIENDIPMFLFEIDSDRSLYFDFNGDQATTEILTERYVKDTESDALSGHDVMVSQYSNGTLRQTSLCELLGSTWVEYGEEHYMINTFNPVIGEPMLQTVYSLDPSEMNFVKLQQGVPDRLGSWSSIGSIPGRAENWRKIVTNGEFKVGGAYVKGYWFVWDEEEQKDIRKPYYGRMFGTYPNIDGSSVCVPLAMEFARQHLDMNDDDAHNFVYFNTTSAAYEALLMSKSNDSGSYYITAGEDGETDSQQMDTTRPVDIVLATYPSDDVLAFSELWDVPLTIEPICSDSFVFIVNAANPADSLTLEEVRGIYSGKITNWSEVGGLDEPITAFQRDYGSGSQTGMEQLVMKDEALADAPVATIIRTMEGLVKAVAEFDNGRASIGYSYKYYIEQLYKSDNVKILNIDGFPPSDTENYPLTVNYYGVIRTGDGEDSAGRRFLDWIRSEEGQKCVEIAGYKPV